MALLGCCAVVDPGALRIAFVEINDAYSSQLHAVQRHAREALLISRGGKEPGGQDLIDALSASLAEAVFSTDPHAPHAAKMIALCLHELRPHPAFIVEATQEARGICIQLVDVPCEDPNNARNAIEETPEIELIRRLQAQRAQ